MTAQRSIDVFRALGEGLWLATVHLPRIVLVTLPALLLHVAAVAAFVYMLFVNGLLPPFSGGPAEPAAAPHPPSIAGVVIGLLATSIVLMAAFLVALIQRDRVRPYLWLGVMELRLLGGNLLAIPLAIVIYGLFFLAMLPFMLGAVFVAGQQSGTFSGGFADLPPGQLLPVAIGGLISFVLALVVIWYAIVFSYRYYLIFVDIVAEGRFAPVTAWRLTRGEGWRLFWLALLQSLALILLIALAGVAFALLAGLGLSLLEADHTGRPALLQTLADLKPMEIAVLAGGQLVVVYFANALVLGSLVAAHRMVRAKG